MTNYELLAQNLNRTAQQFPQLGIPAILAKPILEAGAAGLGWGAGAFGQAAQGNTVDPAPSLYHMMNIAGLGGPGAGLTSQGAKAAPWFSALARAIESAPLKSAPPEQWLGTIKNTPGVKPEELDWSKVPEWLGGQQGLITKEQLLEHAKANQVDVHEVVKGNPRELTPEQAHRMGELKTGVYGGGPLSSADLAEYRALEAAQKASETKFSQWQMPGGENYRELLLTMPKKPLDTSGWKVVREEIGSPSGKRVKVIDSQGLQHADWTVSNETSDAQLIKQAAERTQDEGLGQFHVPGAHAYGDPASDVNRLAHIRFNDRVDAEGKKTLFLEEIQSDWHQKAYQERKRAIKRLMEDRGLTKEQAAAQVPEDYGYQGSRAEQSSEVGLVGIERQTGTGNYWEIQDSNGRFVTNVTDRGLDENQAIAEARRRMNEEPTRTGTDMRVPDAPFKTSWPELSLKRMIKYAIDNGYDSISWTPGKVQAERYDLSKQISKIKSVRSMTDDGDGAQHFVQAYDLNGKEVFSKYARDNELSDLVGKELADKIVAAPDGHQEWKGLDLQVGGEGMKGFYDKILPSTANKLGKKYGAKVGVSKFDTEQSGQYRVTTTQGQFKGQSFETDARGADQAKMGDPTAKIEPLMKSEEVWSLPITDAMRKEVGEKGMPLFSGGKGGSLAAILTQALQGNTDKRK